MKTASAFSTLPESAAAAEAAAAMLTAALGPRVDLLLVYTTEHHASAPMLSALSRIFPDAQIVGGTSCGGVMTEAGFHTSSDGAVGLFGIADLHGSYGVGASEMGEGAFAAGAAAIERALVEAGRDFETPTLVWCCQPPGDEESVIAGIQSVIGGATPIIGGSSADETIGGAWRQFATGGVLSDHVVVAALFPTGRYGAAFQSGYAPTGSSGTVTRASGRQILEIDGHPAGSIYGRWTEGAVAPDQAGMILAKSTPTPLGRIAGDVRGVPMFLLSHPAMMGTGGDLSLFTDIKVGDRVHMMRGSPESLVKRAGLVVSDACAMGGWTPSEHLGGLIIYCGGCMLHVRDKMDEVVAEVREAMPGAPFLGAFTFGEQGPIVDNANRHGNLMVSALTFG